MSQTYAKDMRSTAYRHLEAAEHLYTSSRRHDVAGYLFGIAAECALKRIMSDSGMRPLSKDQRRDDPFYAHFEELKTLLRDSVSGRRQSELRAFAMNDGFMQHWDVSMRYSDGKGIDPKWIARWSKDARAVVDRMDG